MFVKGKSGNAGGRPVMSEEEKKFLDAAAAKAMKTISSIAEKSKSDKVRLSAAIWLAERKYGKAVQPIANENENHPFIVKVI